MKRTIVALTVAAVAGTSAFAYDTTACAGCHGKDFEKKAMNVSKIVKDLSHDEIVTALKGYKAGTFGGAMKAVMQAQASKLSDEDIEAIATQVAGGEKKEATATDAVVDAAKEKATDAVKEVADQAVDKAKEVATEKVQDAVAGQAKDVAKDAAKDAAMDAAKGMMK